MIKSFTSKTGNTFSASTYPNPISAIFLDDRYGDRMYIDKDSTGKWKIYGSANGISVRVYYF